MAYKIIINKRFDNSVHHVLLYLEKEWGKKVADEFLMKIDARIRSLQHHPHIGSLTKYKDIRGIHVTKHNRMFYKVRGNTVIIINLYDTRRKNYG